MLAHTSLPSHLVHGQKRPDIVPACLGRTSSVGDSCLVTNVYFDGTDTIDARPSIGNNCATGRYEFPKLNSRQYRGGVDRRC